MSKPIKTPPLRSDTWESEEASTSNDGIEETDSDDVALVLTGKRSVYDSSNSQVVC